MKIFQKIALAGEDVQTFTRSGMFFDADGNPADVEDGAVAVLGDPIDHEVYNGIKDLNVRKLTAPEAATDKIVLVDYVGVSKADVMNVRYHVGDKVAGTYPHAGEYTRVRVPVMYDEFWLGSENFDTAPEVGQYATVAAGSTALTVVDAPVAGQFCVKIDDTKNLIMGTVNDSIMYRCFVVGLPA